MNDKLVPRCSFSLQRSSGFGKSSTSFAGYLPDYPRYCSCEFQSFGFSRLCGGTAQCPAHALEKVLVCHWCVVEVVLSIVQSRTATLCYIGGTFWVRVLRSLRTKSRSRNWRPLQNVLASSHILILLWPYMLVKMWFRPPLQPGWRTRGQDEAGPNFSNAF